METKVLDKTTSDKVSFITFIIPEFASLLFKEEL
jgi:hypothetical protein